MKPMIRAKFKCESVQSLECGAVYQENVTLRAVYSPDPRDENFGWSEATPCGSLSMTITNPAAFGQFVQGQEYLLDFTPV